MLLSLTQQFSAFTPSLKRFGLFLLFIYLYVLLVGLIGGIDSVAFYKQWVEISLLGYFYLYFFSILKLSRWRSLIVMIPVLAGYLIQDVFYYFYGKVFRLIEILELPELLQVITVGYWVLIICFLVLPLVIFISAINFRRPLVMLLGLLPLCALGAIIEFSPGTYTDFVERYANGIVEYSDTKSVERNGRYTMLLYKEAQREHALNVTSSYHDRENYELQAFNKAKALAQNSNQQNVHVIVLESFLDPTLFKRARFSKEPTHPQFKKIFGKKQGLSISSVFGGATAQAEFEVLCGVPALEKLSSVEFNVFTGSPVFCLPGVLDKLGYRTMATNAFKPNFFNALPAYEGLGFQEIYFPKEYTSFGDTYLSVSNVGSEDFLFDGELFEQNLAFITQAISENNKLPLFNYMMTIYGHTPHILDKSRRPEILKVQSNYADDHLQRAANQFYYRTEAIAKYVKELIKIDKNSLIIMVSDHVPPLRNGPNTYRNLGYMGNTENSYFYNRLLILDKGRPAVYRDIRHFDIPDIIYNYITDGHYCLSKTCSYLETKPLMNRQSYIDEYYSLMAHASD